MSTPLNGSSLRKSGNLRNSGYFDLSDAGNGGAGAMLQFSLSDLNKNDHKDMVEVTLELDDDSLLVRSILPAIGDESTTNNSVAEIFTRSSSASSRICRKFSWLRSSSSRTSSAVEDVAFTPRDARKIQAKLERSRSGAQQALKGLRFINQTTESFDPEKLWRNVESQFENLAKEGLLSRDDFAECIGMVDSKEFATVVFDALVRRKRMNLVRINKDELRDFWLQISNQSFDARLQLFFDMVDSNADGRITREEVKELIMLSASANKLSKLKEQAEEYAALIMEELDPEDLGYIEIWQLETLLLQRDLYMNCSRPLSRNLSWSQNIGFKRRSFFRRIGFKICCFVEENWRRGWILLLWILAMAALFSWKFTQYKNRVTFEVMGYCLSTAKGAAETLKLNMALILLPVCRNTLTWLRSTKARFFVPFDDSINFHKTIASAIVIGIVLHAGNHLTCDFPRIVHSPPIRYELIASYFGVKKPSYRELLSGVEGVTGILMVILMMISFTLATRWFRKKDLKLPSSLHRLTGFNAFWYSHHLLVVVYVLLLIHGNFLYLVRTWWKKNTWMYISVPLLIYVGERILRAFRSTAYSVKINQVSILPGGVMSLIMSKPHGFRYRSGQYIFLQCPLISSFEWHPFSITSAPGDENLSVHIRTLGDWTRELRRVFTESCTPSSLQKYGKSNDLENGKEKCLPKLLVDGPYGAAAQDYRNYDVLLLVGLGIGATPFISILRDLLNERKMAEEQTDSSIEINKSGHKKSHRTTSAHFYWVTRDPGSFEWFKGVMNQVAEMDQKGMIELHNYLTSVYEEGDARSTLLTMVQALNHAKHGVDIVSGTRVRTHFARPNWKDVFAKVATKYPFATVGVFYCGMPMLGKELKKLSQELSHTTSTRFEFHKEYF